MAALIKTSILVTQERGLFQLFCLMFVFEQTFEEKSQPMMFLSRFFQMIDAQGRRFAVQVPAFSLDGPDIHRAVH